MLFYPWYFYAVDTTLQILDGKEVELPHRFERNRSYNSGWYVSKFSLDEKQDKHYQLLLDRIEMFCMVFVNGKRIGHHFGSYTPFEMNISKELVQAENVLAIFVHDQTATIDGNKLYNQIGPTRVSGGYERFKLKGGIYGIPVLEIREPAYIKDIFVKTSTRKGEMEIEYELPDKIHLSTDAKLSFELFKWPDGNKVPLEMKAKSVSHSVNTNILRIDKSENSYTVKWPDAELWSPDHPNLYVLRTTLKNGSSSDVIDTRFGFREFWIEGKSFYLNGAPLRLRGNSI